MRLLLLGALDRVEREEFQRHLEGCPECQAELELLLNAADAVPLMAAGPAASPVRHEAGYAGVPARPVPQSGARSGARERERGNAVVAEQLRALVPAEPAVITKPPPGPRGNLPRSTTPGVARPHARRRFLQTRSPRPAVLGLAGIAIIGVITMSLAHRSQSISFHHVRAGWTGGGAAIKLEGNQLQVLVLHMPKAPVGKGYQVWVVDDSTKRLMPTGTWLKPGRNGNGGVVVPGNYHDWDAAAVYVEPLHGPDTTRSGAVVVADLHHRA